MKVTFPHMGTLYVVIKAILESLDVEVIQPPFTSSKTVELGVKHSPEFACLPLKVNIGNFIEALDAGADTIIMGGGVGPCRFGYYAEVQRQILQDLGYHCEIIVLEPPQGHLRELLAQLRELTGNKSISRIIRALRFAWEKLQVLEAIEKEIHRVRPREETRGATTSVYQQAIRMVDAARSRTQLEEIKSTVLTEIAKIPCIDIDNQVRVGIVGEVYMVLEPFLNYDMERRLEEMGAAVERSIYLGEWIHSNLMLDALRLNHGADVGQAARPYLNHFVGGHGLDTVAHTILYARQGFDGVIQVAPFTCMPEIVAESILPKVSRDFDIPVLTFFLDEHSGEAGCQTRLEAFVDLLVRRKEQGREAAVGRISGN